ncbi:MAG TPA: hypothetical protein VNQ31_07815, partial [Sphingomonadaceae bacterium]|nr:hypothetical protein [Sphingomonadaceae bacterium]
ASATAPTILSAGAGAITEGMPYAVTLVADVPVVFLKLDGAAFTLSGARLLLPPQHYDAGADIVSCQLRAVDREGNATDFSHAVTILAADAPLALDGVAPDGVAGGAWFFRLTASGGTPPYRYSLAAGALPIAETLDPESGLAAGALLAAGSYQFTGQVEDADGATATHLFSVDVAEAGGGEPAEPAITSAPTIAGEPGGILTRTYGASENGTDSGYWSLDGTPIDPAETGATLDGSVYRGSVTFTQICTGAEGTTPATRTSAAFDNSEPAVDGPTIDTAPTIAENDGILTATFGATSNATGSTGEWYRDLMPTGVTTMTLAASEWPGSITFVQKATGPGGVAYRTSAAYDNGLAATDLMSDDFDRDDATGQAIIGDKGWVLDGADATTRDLYKIVSGQLKMGPGAGVAVDGSLATLYYDTETSAHGVRYTIFDTSPASQHQPRIILRRKDDQNMVAVYVNGTTSGGQYAYVAARTILNGAWSGNANNMNPGGGVVGQVLALAIPALYVGMKLDFSVTPDHHIHVKVDGVEYGLGAESDWTAAEPSPNDDVSWVIPAGVLRDADATGAGLIGSATVSHTLPADDVTIYAYSAPFITSVTGASNWPDVLTIDATVSGHAGPFEAALMAADGTPLISRRAVTDLGGGSFRLESDAPIAEQAGAALQVWAGSTGDGAAEVMDVPSRIARERVTALPLGLNMDSALQWSDNQFFYDLMWQSEWRTEGNKYIMPRDADTANRYYTSDDGLNGTVKMDYDGRIYADNSLDLTSYTLFLPGYTHPDYAGTYNVTLAPHVVVNSVDGRGIKDWSYDSETGTGTLTREAGSVTLTTIDIDATTIPPGGLLPSIRKAGSTGIATPVLIDTVKAMTAGGPLRFMSDRGTNSASMIGDTARAFDQRTPAKRWTGFVSQGPICRELMVEIANQCGRDLWYNWIINEDMATVADDVAYIAAHLDPGLKLYIERSNEPWNLQFPQYRAYSLIGARMGLGDPNLTTTAEATPQTVIDAATTDRWVSGRVLKVAMTAGECVTDNQHWTYRARQNLAIGTPLPAAKVAVSPSDPNWEAVYKGWVNKDNPGDTDNTGILAYNRARAWDNKRTWVAARAAWAIAGRNPTHIIPVYNVQSGETFSGGDLFEWDDLWQELIGGYVAAPSYWLDNYGDYKKTDYPLDKKDLIYTDMPAALDYFFEHYAMDAAVGAVDRHWLLKQALRAWLTGKGVSGDAIGLASYEGGNWHFTLSGWPEQVGAFNPAVGAKPYQLVVGSDEKTYRAKGSDVPAGAGNAPPNATYWDEYWDKATTDAQRAKPVWDVTTFFRALMTDERFGEVEKALFDRWNRKMPDSPLTVFNLGTRRPDNTTSTYQYWGMLFSATDTDVSGGPNTNWRYKALTEAATAIADGEPIIAD